MYGPAGFEDFSDDDDFDFGDGGFQFSSNYKPHQQSTQAGAVASPKQNVSQFNDSNTNGMGRGRGVTRGGGGFPRAGHNNNAGRGQRRFDMILHFYMNWNNKLIYMCIYKHF